MQREQTTLNIKSREPLQNQLARLIKSGFIDTMEPGDKLPPIKKISEHYNTGLGIAQEAFSLLRKHGFVYSRVGCGTFVADKELPEGYLSITYPQISHFAYAKVFKKLIAAYKKKHPKVNIKMQSALSNDLYEYMEHVDQGNTDVAIVLDSHIADQKNTLMALDEKDCRQVDDLCDSSVVNLFKLNRRLLAWPLLYSSNVLICNKRFFDNAGLPEPDSLWDFEQFSDTINKLNKANPKTYGFWLTANSNRWLNFLQNSGVDIVNVDGRPTPKIKSKEFKPGVKLVKELLNMTPNLLTERVLVHGFMQGKIGIICGSCLSTFDLLKEYSNHTKVNELFLRPLPKIKKQESLLVGAGVGIVKKAEHPIQARDFCKFIFSREAQKIILEEHCGLPARKDIETPECIKLGNIKVNSYSAFKKYKTNTVIRASRSDSKWFHFDREMYMYWSGLMSIDELINEINK
jgi:ABC-type glycerol-3-phosphate transport system substrate-binding protein